MALYRAPEWAAYQVKMGIRSKAKCGEERVKADKDLEGS
jgi:hypothetical protein